MNPSHGQETEIDGAVRPDGSTLPGHGVRES